MTKSSFLSAARVLGVLLVIAVAFTFIPFFGASGQSHAEDYTEYSPLETIVLEDEYAAMTEEELGVLPVGQYKISIPGVGYLCYEDVTDADNNKPLTVSETYEGDTFAIVYQTTDPVKTAYTISAGDEVYTAVGVGDRSISMGGKPVCNNYRTTYSYLNSTSGKYPTTQDNSVTMRWYFEDNGDGTYKFLLHDTSDPYASNSWIYYACWDAENAQIVMTRDIYLERDGRTPANFKVEMTQRGTTQFTQYISYGGKIALRLPPNIEAKAGLTPQRGQKWANDVEKAYRYFIDLTDFVAYDNIIVKAFSNTTYMAYVTAGYNVITASYSATDNEFGGVNNWYVDDIKELVQRGEEANDWNFCILHEMGHMFDTNRDWRFETECQTDFKLAYCLYRGGAAATPSEFRAKDVFTYDNIEECYRIMGGDFTKTQHYDFYGAAYKLMMMQKAIGWKPVYQTFHWFSANARLDYSDPDKVSIPYQNYQRFQLFIDKISEYSGVDCQNTFFSKTDWAVFMQYYGDPDAVIPGQEPPDDGAELIKVSPLYGQIENWSRKTYFIVGIESTANADMFAKLKNKTYTMKVTLKDETTGIGYVIDPYHFDAPGDEFYGSDFLRLNFCNNGVEPMPGHEYTLKLEIFEGETRKFVGTSAEGAFCSTNDAFNNNGAIMPSRPKYDVTILCAEHTPEVMPAVEPTCGQDGLTEGSRCAVCGEILVPQEVIPATGEHQYVDAVTPPTATERGYTTHTCSVCGDSYVDNYVDPTGILYGDVNGDGIVNKKDSLSLKKFLADSFYEIDLDAADVTGDGSVNKKDSLRLKQYLAGWDVVLGA